MVMNYAKYADFYPKKTKAPASFGDDGKISAYARSSVYHMQRAGILAGKGEGMFDPKGNATRAECAKVFGFYQNTQDDYTARMVIENFYDVADYYGSVSGYYLADYTHDGYEDLFVITPQGNGSDIIIYSGLGGYAVPVFSDYIGPYAYNDFYYVYEEAKGAYLMHYLKDTSTGTMEQGLDIFYGDYNGAQEYIYRSYVRYDTFFEKTPAQFYTNENTYSAFKAKSTLLFGSNFNEMTYHVSGYEKAVGKWGF